MKAGPVPLRLTDIYIYPIKSLGGIRLDSARVEKRGLALDRRWMLVDENHQFLTQRKYAQMALLQVVLDEDELLVWHKHHPHDVLRVPYQTGEKAQLPVTVWEDRVKAASVSAEADAWFSRHLGVNCRLVQMPESSQRLVDPEYAANGEVVSFADGYPYLLIGQASLNDLNQRLTYPLPMNRFRPNFVFSGGLPYEEEDWGLFRIGESLFRGVKPCGRCVVTTIDQETSAKGPEPLRTLAGYRSKGNKVLFGQNVLPVDVSEVRVGDEVEPLEEMPQP